jgi:hypothetical protein
MNRLGLPEVKAQDGCGTWLILDATLGAVAAGADGIGGTDDDM